MKKQIVFFTFLLGLVMNLSAQSSKVSSAIQYLSNGELDRAKDAIESAISHEKTMNEAKTWLYRGKIYNAIASDQTGKYSGLAMNPLDTALKCFKTALSFPDVKSYKKNMLLDLQYLQGAYFNEGASAYGAKDFSTAYRTFKGSAEANNLQFDIDPNIPIDTGVIFNIALTADKIGKTEEAIATYKKLVDMKYRDPYVYQALSDMLLKIGQPKEALEVIEAGRDSYPNDENILVTELNFYLSQGRAAEIVDKLKEAIVLDPSNADLYFALGNSYGELMKLDSLNSTKYFEGAIEAYKKAVEINPNNFEANLNLGALYYNTAIEYNRQMINLPLDAELEFKKLESQRNDLYKSALPYFEKALSINSGEVALIISLKEIYAKTGNYEKSNEMKKLLGE